MIYSPSIPIILEHSSKTLSQLRPKQDKPYQIAIYLRTVKYQMEQKVKTYQSLFENYLLENQDFTLHGFYCDIRKSGIDTANNPEINRLLSDCSNKKIDLIFTPSLSCISRSLNGLLYFADRIEKLKQPIITVFGDTQIATINPKDLLFYSNTTLGGYHT